MEFVFVLLYVVFVALVLLFFRGARVLSGDEDTPPPVVTVPEKSPAGEDDGQLPLPIGR